MARLLGWFKRHPDAISAFMLGALIAGCIITLVSIYQEAEATKQKLFLEYSVEEKCVYGYEVIIREINGENNFTILCYADDKWELYYNNQLIAYCYNECHILNKTLALEFIKTVER